MPPASRKGHTKLEGTQLDLSAEASALIEQARQLAGTSPHRRDYWHYVRAGLSDQTVRHVLTVAGLNPEQISTQLELNAHLRPPQSDEMAERIENNLAATARDFAERNELKEVSATTLLLTATQLYGSQRLRRGLPEYLQAVVNTLDEWLLGAENWMLDEASQAVLALIAWRFRTIETQRQALEELAITLEIPYVSHHLEMMQGQLTQAQSALTAHVVSRHLGDGEEPT